MKKIILPAITLLVVYGLSCRKDYKSASNLTNVPTGEQFASTDEVFDKLALKPKIVTIDAAVGATFNGNSGTQYTFPPNSFVDAAGNPVTGNVTLEVTEYTEKSDMLFSGALPMSDSGALISGGELNVTASKDGQPLQMKPGKQFKAVMPVKTDTSVKFNLFMGEKTNGGLRDKVKWKLRTDTAGKTVPVKPSKYHDSLEIVSDEIRFCNADAFGKMNWQKFKITIVAEGATIPASADLVTYAVYDGQKSLWKCGWYGAPVNNVYSEHHIPDIPVHFVSFIVIDNVFYGGISAATPKTGENYTVTLKKRDATAFKAEVAALP
jgi:hypothetical protein